MGANTFGKLFAITSFGESHGEAVGVVIDGCPANVEINIAFIQNELDRRRPGQSSITTQRKELDKIEVLSGIFDGRTTGAPIAIIVRNENQKSSDYNHLKDVFRPSHADFAYDKKYGHRDYRGGGRSSARETVARVIGGAVAKLILKEAGILINAYVSQVGNIKVATPYSKLDLSKIDSNNVRCPDGDIAKRMETLIKDIRKQGDTIGGKISCVIKGCVVGLGEPAFDKLHADLGKAMLSINAVKGFEIGSGFEAVEMKGSEHNDLFVNKDGQIKTTTNYSGGVQGGISNGMDIYFNVAFKPTATIMQKQASINKKGETVELDAKGRHDPCVVPRAVPIVEGMAAMVILDHLLRFKAYSK